MNKPTVYKMQRTGSKPYVAVVDGKAVRFQTWTSAMAYANVNSPYARTH